MTGSPLSRSLTSLTCDGCESQDDVHYWPEHGVGLCRRCIADDRRHGLRREADELDRLARQDAT